MLEIISILITISLIPLLIKIFTTTNAYQKILGLYLVSTNSIVLILINTVTDSEKFLDISIILFLLLMAAVIFLLFHQKINEKKA